MNGFKYLLLVSGLLLLIFQAMGVRAQTPLGTEFTYQGRLLDQGRLADGLYDIRFILYDSEAGGSQVGPIIIKEDIEVSRGLVSLSLDFGANAFEGDARWLEISIRPGSSTGGFSLLSPRLPVQPAPYALFSAETGNVSWNAVSGLVGAGPNQLASGSHDHFGQSWVGESNIGLEIVNNLFDAGNTAIRGQISTGAALRGDAIGGYGVYGYSQNYGVYGEGNAPTQGRGYGGFFLSNSGVGVYGQSTATSTASNSYTPGVFGKSQHGVGVLGETLSNFGVGVYGKSSTGTAVMGNTNGGFGVYGYSRDHGIRGIGNALTQGRGYGGYFSSSTGIGAYGESTAQTSSQNLYAPGVYGYSQNGVGVRGRSQNSFSAFFGRGSGFPGVYIDGTLAVTGSKSGFIVDIAVNDGPLPLETGDVVVITGHGDPIMGEIPLVRVRKAESAESPGVVGVVDQPFEVPISNASEAIQRGVLPKPAAEIARIHAGSAIETGQYLTIVTLGSYRALKVDATYGAVQPGHLLVSSENPGYAKRADNPRAGTIIGKSLGELSQGTGIIPVMVTLH